MKALSLLQPWAGCIVHIGKPTENRTWYSGYRGDLVICASARVEPGWDQERWTDFLAEHYAGKVGGVPERFRDFREFCLLGHALGAERVVNCDREMKSSWDMPDQWHFRLKGAMAFPAPFPVKGRLGLFELVCGRCGSVEVWQAAGRWFCDGCGECASAPVVG